VLDADKAAFLQGGCALIVATVSPDGEPYATRGWGLTLLPDDAVRLLLAADDAVTIGLAAAGGALAVTAADVRTLRSVQLKGQAVGVEPAATDDTARAARYCDAFFTDIEETDGTPRAQCDRLMPAGYVACTIAVDAVFDQTPGPGAGASLGAVGP
jgi:hypothetical protein